MKICLSILAPLVSLCVGGCSNIQNFDVPRDAANLPSVQTIVQQVNCELATLASDNYQYIGDMVAGDYVIAVELDLTVNDDGSLAPAFTYTNGLFSFNAGAKLDVQREQNFTETLFYSIADLRDLMNEDRKMSLKVGHPVNSLACPTEVNTPLAGDLGIVPSVHIAMNTPHLASQTKLSGAKAGEFGGYAKFVILKNLNAVGPTWTLKQLKGPGSLAGVSETNTDQITFAFAERAATGTLPQAPNSAATNQAKARALTIIAQIKSNQVNTVLSQIQVNTR